MALSKSEAKLLLERLIFDESDPQEWVQDVWGLNSCLGDRAAKLVDVLNALIDTYPVDRLDDLAKKMCQDLLE
jgi:hypothetical protein